jgi:hypothetical protein
MKAARNTLADYYGKIIIFKGYFKSLIFPNNINSFVYREEDNMFVPKNQCKVNPITGTNNMLATIPNSSIMTYPFINYLDYASLITKIEGIGNFENVKENHFIIKTNIEATYSYLGIKIGDNIIVEGMVGAYIADNKTPGYDYCITEILGIKKLI